MTDSAVTERAPTNAERARSQPARTFPQMLTAFKSQIALALPKHLNADRVARIALTCYRTTPLLAKCAPDSVFAAVIQAAQLGLEPGLNGQAYLVPYWNGKRRMYECQMIPGYRGLIALARRSGELDNVAAHIVYANDVYELALGDTPRISHTPNMDSERGAPRFVYSVAWIKNSQIRDIEPMSWAEVLRIRERTKSRNQSGAIVGPWVTDIEEMARKTVLRRASKRWPMSIELATAIAMDSISAKGLSQGLELDTVIKGEYSVAEVADDDAGAAPALPEAAQEQGEAQQGEASGGGSRIREKVDARAARVAAAEQAASDPAPAPDWQPTPEEEEEIRRREAAEAAAQTRE